MRIHKLLAVSLLSTGIVLCDGPSLFAGDPVKPGFGFSTLKSASPAAAKDRAAAWLKATGKFDAAAFDRVWAEEDRPVLDRTVDSLALGSPEAKALLAAMRQADAPAPAETPAILKDMKQDSFFRTNLALAFAKAAGSKKVYEEALEALNGAMPEAAVDPAALFFFKAVCEHATMRKDAATSSITRLLDDVADAPDRYKMVAMLMFFEMQNWSADPKDLSNIERLMDNSGRRLELARGGEKTQDIQKKIVFRLDELIKELENKNKPGQCNGGNCPNGGQPGNVPGGNQNNPSNPAADSVIMQGSGQGKITDRDLRQLAEKWGTLPPEKRAKIIEDLKRDNPVKYKQEIERYLDALNKVHGYK